jgi:hypothetical protein
MGRASENEVVILIDIERALADAAMPSLASDDTDKYVAVPRQ